MLVKSMCKRSNGVVATIGCRGTLGKSPTCCKQCMQDLMDCCIWLIIPSHQKHSHNKDRVWLQPWWPASLWQPVKVVTQCALGTMKSRISLVSPLGVEQRYKAHQWIVKFCQFHRISWPSLLEACSSRSAFKSVFFCAFSQSRTALNVGSSLWALAQSVTCICMSVQPAATCTSHSKLRSPSTMVGLCFLAWCAASNATPLRIDLTVSGSNWVVTQLSMSATVLSHPHSKLNCARALTHWWPVVSRLSVIIM